MESANFIQQKVIFCESAHRINYRCGSDFTTQGAGAAGGASASGAASGDNSSSKRKSKFKACFDKLLTKAANHAAGIEVINMVNNPYTSDLAGGYDSGAEGGSMSPLARMMNKGGEHGITAGGGSSSPSKVKISSKGIILPRADSDLPSPPIASPKGGRGWRGLSNLLSLKGSKPGSPAGKSANGVMNGGNSNADDSELNSGLPQSAYNSRGATPNGPNGGAGTTNGGLSSPSTQARDMMMVLSSFQSGGISKKAYQRILNDMEAQRKNEQKKKEGSTFLKSVLNPNGLLSGTSTSEMAAVGSAEVHGGKSTAEEDAGGGKTSGKLSADGELDSGGSKSKGKTDGNGSSQEGKLMKKAGVGSPGRERRGKKSPTGREDSAGNCDLAPSRTNAEAPKIVITPTASNHASKAGDADEQKGKTTTRETKDLAKELSTVPESAEKKKRQAGSAAGETPSRPSSPTRQSQPASSSGTASSTHGQSGGRNTLSLKNPTTPTGDPNAPGASAASHTSRSPSPAPSPTSFGSSLRALADLIKTASNTNTTSSWYAYSSGDLLGGGGGAGGGASLGSSGGKSSGGGQLGKVTLILLDFYKRRQKALEEASYES